MLSISLFIYNDFVLLCSFFFFFFNDTATTEIYTLSLHDALPILLKGAGVERLVDVRSVPRSRANPQFNGDALPDPRSEEHTSELQSRLHLVCRLLLEKKKKPPILPVARPTDPQDNSASEPVPSIS